MVVDSRQFAGFEMKRKHRPACAHEVTRVTCGDNTSVLKRSQAVISETESAQNTLIIFIENFLAAILLVVLPLDAALNGQSSAARARVTLLLCCNNMRRLIAALGLLTLASGLDNGANRSPYTHTNERVSRSAR